MLCNATLEIMLLRFTMLGILLFSAMISPSKTARDGSAVGSIQADTNIVKKDFRILFLGNSLTYTNDLPDLVRKEALQRGLKIRADMIALPDYAIIDHWVDGKARERIETGKYDFVIVQQGPSSLEPGKQLLIEGGRKFSELCSKNNARLCYFMVWPSIHNYASFGAVIRNHEEAARVNGALLCPVGQVWKFYIDTTGSYEYYGPDGFHPSVKGSQVAAQVIVTSLIGDK